MKVSEILSGVELKPVPRGRMACIGWYAGYLVVDYGSAKYIMGSDVDIAELDKILKVPYPDSLLQKLKAKHGWKSHKVAV